MLERGEAFFKVAHDASRPFVVEAEPRRIVVTGTEFDVRRAPDALEVSVAEGHVKVETPAVLHGTPNAPVTALVAGDDAHFAAGASRTGRGTRRCSTAQGRLAQWSRSMSTT